VGTLLLPWVLLRRTSRLVNLDYDADSSTADDQPQVGYHWMACNCPSEVRM